jgi:hypothetical protein
MLMLSWASLPGDDNADAGDGEDDSGKTGKDGGKAQLGVCFLCFVVVSGGGR